MKVKSQAASQKILPMQAEMHRRLFNKAIRGYLIALFDGFRRRQNCHDYVFQQEEGDRTRQVEFPIYTPDESVSCVNALTEAGSRFYQRRFHELVVERLGVETHSDMWEVANIDLQQGESRPPRRYAFVDAVPPVWSAYQRRPAAFSDGAWRASVVEQREKAKSVMGYLDRATPQPGDYMYFDGHREEEFAAFTHHLGQKIAGHQEELGVVNAELAACMAASLAAFDAATGDDTVSTALKGYRDCYALCDRMAGLEADILFTQRVQSLHNLQNLSPLQKLARFVGERFRTWIPCHTVMELHCHILFLVQNTNAYVSAAIGQPADTGGGLLQSAARVDEMGRSVALTDEERVQQGFLIADMVEEDLRDLLTELGGINYAEANRREVEEQLGVIADRLRAAEPDLRAGIDAVRNQVWDSQAIPMGMSDTSQLCSRVRLAKLAEWAPGGHDPAAIHTFEELVALYSGTQVTEAGLRELYECGLTNSSDLLNHAVQYLDLPDRQQVITYLLSEAALVEHEVRDVGTLAWAHHALVRNEADRVSLRLYALLSGVNQLFPQVVEEAPDGDEPDAIVPLTTDWLTTAAKTVLLMVAEKTGVDLHHYWRRDGAAVTSLLRRMVLSFYLGRVDKRAIRESELFQALSKFWDYLEQPAGSVQLLPGEPHAIDIADLRSQLLDTVTRLFKHADYTRSLRARDELLRPTNRADHDRSLASQLLSRGIPVETQLLCQKQVTTYQVRMQAVFAQQRMMQKMYDTLVQTAGPVVARQVIQQMQQQQQAITTERPLLLLEDRRRVVQVAVGDTVRVGHDRVDEGGGAEARDEHAEARDEHADARDEHADARDEHADARDEQRMREAGGQQDATGAARVPAAAASGAAAAAASSGSATSVLTARARAGSAGGGGEPDAGSAQNDGQLERHQQSRH
jgi:hypothetical protein